MNVIDIINRKKESKKISMVLCYDYTSALMVAKTEMDIVFVGDSLSMTMHGYENTVGCTVEMMEMHTRAVAKGAPKKFILADLPFLSMRKGLEPAMDAVERLMRAGANAVKFEGFVGEDGLIEHVVNSGVPVMGHVGLTPQFIHQMGGFRVQGRDDASAEKILQEALALERAGCFAVVLEGMPANLAKKITEILDIPTIGIGAGPDTDGQVLVWQDLLGMNPEFKPKFVKTYVDLYTPIVNALSEYDREVKAGIFPEEKHCYK